ncbi:hypothetical protein KAR91_31710 [Candidatus Pacearchaeota archaeon]|nr:hypothetical protein [Candidatus Pacearchaeota archaeon]
MKIEEALEQQRKVLCMGNAKQAATVIDGVLRWSEFPQAGMAVPLAFILSEGWVPQPKKVKP